MCILIALNENPTITQAENQPPKLLHYKSQFKLDFYLSIEKILPSSSDFS